MRKRILTVLAVLGVLALAAAVWAGYTFREAEQHLRVAQAELEQARTDLQDLDGPAARDSVMAAQGQSAAAARLANRWIWRLAAVVPGLGDSADAARAVVLAADSAVTALVGITDGVAALDAENLVDGTTVNLESVAAAGTAAQAGIGPLEQAQAYLAGAPQASDGAWVVGPIADAQAQLGANVDELASTASALKEAGELLPGALGADGPKTYLVAVQAPSETRGTGGLLGTWAVVRADRGKITVVDSGANEDLPDLPRMPRGMDAGYLQRYHDDPTLVANMNLSPDFPVAAQLWLDSWQKKTGQRLDGVVGLDVTALGRLLTATGTTLTGPDGATYDGAGFADFALRGVYDKFPDLADTPARRAYQDALGQKATAALLGLDNPVAVLRAAADLVGHRRIAVWVADPATQEVLAGTQLGHSLQPARPHSVEPVLNNVGWSKLDTYIDRTFDYTVGRCPDENGQVRSELTMTLVSDIPPGTVLPEYVVGTVPKKADGPVNQVYLQVHLPPGAVVADVLVDGKSSQWGQFEEAGRPMAGVLLGLPPRQDRVVQVVFDEPADDAAGQVLVQPMARDAQVTVGERGC